MTSVLYDLPGPRAVVRNRVISIVSSVAIAALLVYVGYRFYATGQFDSLKWQQFEYVAVQKELRDGYLATLKVAAISTVLALAFGALFAAMRLSDKRAVRVPATYVVELFRAIPLLVLIFFGFYVPLQYHWHVDTLWALVFGLTLYNGSVLSEIFRAGILSLPRGQSEAAYALGLRKSQVMWSILLPQAVRAMLPAIVSQLVVLLKDTALGFIINYHELLFYGKQIGGRLVFEFPYVPAYLVVTAVYVTTCGLLSLLAFRLQKRLIRGKRVRPLPIDDPSLVK